MLGYLNAPSPFNEEGWFNTQDVVEVDGDYVRIVGRKSELINVGGERVHPTEIENVLLQLENVRDVTVFAKPNAVTGRVVGRKLRRSRLKTRRCSSSASALSARRVLSGSRCPRR